ncbi:MAG: antitoxin FitA [bacterium]|jgi:plasmid stability protein
MVADVPKTVQIRNLDDDVYAALVRRAAETGISVPELLRIEATKLASRQSMAAWLLSLPRPTTSSITTADVIASLDESRGPWPDAGG